LENKINPFAEGFLYWDPMTLNNKYKENTKINKVFSDVFVFIVDGGCYNEYQNFCEVSKRLNKKVNKNREKIDFYCKTLDLLWKLLYL